MKKKSVLRRALTFFALGLIFFVAYVHSSQSGDGDDNSFDDRLLSELTACKARLAKSGHVPIKEVSYPLLGAAAPVDFIVSTTVRTDDGKIQAGTVFKRVELPATKRKGWQQITLNGHPGPIWIKVMGRFTHDIRNGKQSRADRECKKRGGRVPKREELEMLKSAFDLSATGLLSPLGREEFHKLFVDMDHFFWSSTLLSHDQVWVFGGNYGTSSVFHIDATTELSVLCVSWNSER